MESAETGRTKAIFIGISYTQIPSSQLGWVPYWYVKDMAKELIKKDVFEAKECLIFADFKPNDIGEIKVKPPTKTEIIVAFQDMIGKAVEGDICLFYYCGHGIAFSDPETYKFVEREGNRGSLNTLKQGRLDMLDPFHDTEFKEIISHVKPGVHLTMLIHCCHSGVMFVTPEEDPSSYAGPGIALTSVDATIPTKFEPSDPRFMGDLFSRGKDFTKIILQVIIQEAREVWPTYKQLFDILTDGCLENPASDEILKKLPDFYQQRLKGKDLSVLNKPMIYYNPGNNPEITKFLNQSQE